MKPKDALVLKDKEICIQKARVRLAKDRKVNWKTLSHTSYCKK